jgi:hypothetical protein
MTMDTYSSQQSSQHATYNSIQYQTEVGYFNGQIVPVGIIGQPIDAVGSTHFNLFFARIDRQYSLRSRARLPRTSAAPPAHIHPLPISLLPICPCWHGSGATRSRVQSHSLSASLQTVFQIRRCLMPALRSRILDRTLRRRRLPRHLPRHPRHHHPHRPSHLRTGRT